MNREYSLYKDALVELFHKAIDSGVEEEVIEADVLPYVPFHCRVDNDTIEELFKKDGLHCETEFPIQRRAWRKPVYIENGEECFVLVVSASVKTVLDILERELSKRNKTENKKQGFVQTRKKLEVGEN